jgi:two-component system invasion response regulator UvrY
MKKVTVVLADDHNMIRQGLIKIIESTTDIEVVGEVNNGLDVVDEVTNKKPDIIVLDISMPGKNGFEIIKDLKAFDKIKNTKVLVLSMHPEDKFALRAIKAGASGYLTKESAADELLNALRKIGQGGKYITSNLAEKLAFDFALDTGKDPLDELSDREFQVLQLLANGISQQEIAAELHLSPSTINTYRSRILEKLNLSTTAELIRFALEKGIVDN